MAKKTIVSAEDFVVAWQRAGNLDEVASVLKLSRASAYARGAKYRKMGVELKKFPRTRRPSLDVKALNALAKKERKGG
jgi:transposase